MNSETGEVRDERDVPTDPQERQKWIKFIIGETVEVKGIKFVVKDVAPQRLVLKFKK